MTTGMKEPRTQRREEPRRDLGWVWAIVALVIIIGLLVWAFRSSSNRNENVPNATTPQVQSSATGGQGSVGHFAEPIVPNSQNQQGQNANGLTGTPNNVPPDTINRAPANNQQSAQQSLNQGGTGGTAGNTGITTSTDSIGGAPVQTKNAKP